MAELTFVVGDIKPVRGLCPYCDRRSVVRIELLVKTPAGPRLFHRFRCRECRARIERMP